MGQNVEKFIDNFKSEPGFENIMTVEHRSNNSKRDFLFCNKIQGKHIPSKPSDTFRMLNRLIDIIEAGTRNERLLVIGFAETATAIGAYLGEHLDNCVYYMQTTRETCNNMYKLADFSEEHSHATEQYLYSKTINIKNFSYILFVDDEITTGKTILNFIDELNKTFHNVKYGVASICNWQDQSSKSTFEKLGIDTFSIISGTIKDRKAKMDVNILVSDPNNYGFPYSHCDDSLSEVKTVKINSADPFTYDRVGHCRDTAVYEEMLGKIHESSKDFIKGANKVLVLGTEEFMYVPMIFADILECIGFDVRFHATSRSSIDIIGLGVCDEVAMKSKYKIHSPYDDNRNTFIYNLDKYDKVIVITDGVVSEHFKHDLVTSLYDKMNVESNILFLKLTYSEGLK